MSPNDGALFITWNDSRRSKSLCRELQLQRVVLVAGYNGAWRHVSGMVATAGLLMRRRPLLVWYQFSLALGIVLAIYRRLAPHGRIHVVADVHTKALRRRARLGFGAVSDVLKGWALRSCCATVVTNEENAAFARRRFGVSPLTLPDPLPDLLSDPGTVGTSADRPGVIFVCSFATDEPLDLIEEVCSRLAPAVDIRITGDHSTLDPRQRRRLATVAALTGHLPEPAYWSALRTAGCIVVLSTEPACVPCGALEALATGKRAVIADDPQARAVLGSCATYTRLTAADLYNAIQQSLSDDSASSQLTEEYRTAWTRAWSRVRTPLLACHRAIAEGARKGFTQNRQDIAAEVAFYGIRFRDNPLTEHIASGYDEIHQLGFAASAGNVVLDLGCGTGAHALRLAAAGNDVIAVDLVLAGVVAARERFRNAGLTGRFIVADATDLPLRSQGIETVLGALLLHHFPDRRPVVAEMARVAMSRVVVLEPNAHNLATWFAMNVLNRVWRIRGMTPNQLAFPPQALVQLLSLHRFALRRLTYVHRPWSDRHGLARACYDAVAGRLPLRFRANKFLAVFERRVE